mmetsp:Transcript_12330/g.39494  ORF Transcript_12330/g.39494 Transcript_12330/m.39494 type:complete len:98 (-) Transcript_12330:142-435(-)
MNRLRPEMRLTGAPWPQLQGPIVLHSRGSVPFTQNAGLLRPSTDCRVDGNCLPGAALRQGPIDDHCAPPLAGSLKTWTISSLHTQCKSMRSRVRAAV